METITRGMNFIQQQQLSYWLIITTVYIQYIPIHIFFFLDKSHHQLLNVHCVIPLLLTCIQVFSLSLSYAFSFDIDWILEKRLITRWTGTSNIRPGPSINWYSASSIKYIFFWIFFPLIGGGWQHRLRFAFQTGEIARIYSWHNGLVYWVSIFHFIFILFIHIKIRHFDQSRWLVTTKQVFVFIIINEFILDANK